MLLVLNDVFEIPYDQNGIGANLANSCQHGGPEDL
jgi:hypothetical protein